MVTVEGIEYLTKEEAALRCFEFAQQHPGTRFDNFAHCKVVRRPTTEEERQGDGSAGRCRRLEVGVYGWDKLFTDSRILATHPELKGLWRETAYGPGGRL